MRHAIVRVIVLVLLMLGLWAGTALAKDAVFFFQEDPLLPTEENVYSAAGTREAQYFLTGEYLYRLGSEDARPMPIQMADEGLLARAILCSSQDALYALDMEEEVLYILGEDRLWQPVKRFMNLGARIERTGSDVLTTPHVVGNRLVFLLEEKPWDGGSYAFISVNIAQDSVSVISDSGITALSCYDGESLLARMRSAGAGEQASFSACVVDPGSGRSVEVLASLDIQDRSGVTQLAWDAQHGALLGVSGDWVLRHTPEGWQETAPLVTLAEPDAWHADVLPGGVYVQVNRSGLWLRDTAEAGRQQTPVRIYGSVHDDLLRQGFSARNPQAPALMTLGEASLPTMRALLKSKNPKFDLFLMPATGAFPALLAEGLLAPLDPALLAQVQTMPSPLQAVLIRDDRLYGFPVLSEAYYLRVQDNYFETAGLEAMPATYEALLAMWVDFENRPQIRKHDLSFTNLYHVKYEIIRWTLLHYLFNRSEEQGEISFDTPAFRSALNSIRRLPYPDNGEEEPGVADRPAIFLFEEDDPLSVDWYLTDTVGRPATTVWPVPPFGREETGQEAVVRNELRAWVYVLNPRAPHMEQALEYLRYVSTHLPKENRALLHPDVLLPEQAPYYADYVLHTEMEISGLKRRLVLAQGEEKADLQAELDEWVAQRGELEQAQWLFSPEGIAQYQRLAERFALHADLPALQNGFAGLDYLTRLCMGYYAGELTEDQVIAAMDLYARGK